MTSEGFRCRKSHPGQQDLDFVFDEIKGTFFRDHVEVYHF